MQIDNTAMLVTAILSTWVAGTFTAVVSLRHNDGANRLWAVGFCVFATGTWAAALQPAASSRAVQAALSAAAFGFLPLALAWGAAQLRERRAGAEGVLAVLVVAAAGWVGVSVAADRDEGPAWATVGALCAVGCLLSSVRFLDGPLRHNLNARILVAVGVVSALSLTAEFVESATRPDLPYDVAAVVLTALLAVAAPCLTALRVEQSANWWATRDETARRDLLGLLSANAFRQDAEERLRRAARIGASQYLIRVHVDGLAEINTAFGRDAGDAALAFAARILAHYTPPTTLLGNLGAGQFAILSSEEGTALEASVRAGLLRDPLPPLLPTRFDVTTAVAAAGPDSTVDDLLAETRALITAPAASAEESPHADSPAAP